MQIEKNQDVNSVNVCDVLMEMRQYRMGLIQTADQLRFSYMAVIEGCKHVLSTSTVDSGIDNGAICQVRECLTALNITIAYCTLVW